MSVVLGFIEEIKCIWQWDSQGVALRVAGGPLQVAERHGPYGPRLHPSDSHTLARYSKTSREIHLHVLVEVCQVYEFTNSEFSYCRTSSHGFAIRMPSSFN